MSWTHRLEFLTLHLAALATAAGCQSALQTGTVGADAGMVAPAAVHTAATSEEPIAGTAAPVSERDLQEQREFAEAIEGLRFENGTITVEERLAGSDADARAHYDEGRTLKESNRRTAAIKAFAHAVRTAPTIPALYVALGDAFITKGKTEYAADAYRTAATLDPSDTEALSQLALTLARDSRADEAIATMQSVLAIDPDNGFAHERLAIWHYYAGDDDAAWRHVEGARRAGHPVPEQFLALLEQRTPAP